MDNFKLKNGITTSVAVIGGGMEGYNLLSVLTAERKITVIGITDATPPPESISIIKKYSIPHISDFKELLAKEPDILIVSSSNSYMMSEITELKSPNTGIICGKSTALFLELLEKRQQAKEEIKNLLNDARDLYRIGVTLTSSEKLEEVLDNLLTEALQALSAPAGSIALHDDKTQTLTLKATSGFSPNLSKVTQWKRRPGGMTDHILQKKIPTVIPDIEKYSFVDNEVLLNEGIKSLICVPLIASENIIGILYIDDFKTRSWTQREIDFLTLLGIQAAYAIEKFSLIETISETQNYLKNVLDNSADIIITTDQSGRVVEFNKGASKLLGYDREEIIGVPVEVLWEKPEDRRRVMKAIEASGSVLNYETRLKTKDGKLIDASLTLSYIRNAAGEIIGTVGISKDITEKKRLELAIHERSLELQDLNDRLEEKVIERTRELERANRELERSNKLKSQFIATMSHELRTPLNSILGFSELLIDEVFGPLNEKQKRYVSNIYNSGSHLLQLINNVLDIAKIESGKMELSYEGFSVAQSISEVQTVVKTLADKKAQKLTIKIADDVSIIKADKIKFKQILYNILSNGVKFTPEGGEITLSAEMLDTNCSSPILEKVHSYLGAEKCLKISVADSGIGIREEDQERVFSEFEQVDSSHSRKYEGTGLGLALTKKLVELHGGAIFVESEEGKGSTFTVIIPPFDVSSVHSEIQSLPVKDKLNFDGIEPEIARRSEYPLILVAEDDRSTSEIITLSLVREGYRVAHAYTGMEVISKAREFKPFAIILDVMLPEKDGWEVIQELKLDHELKDIPVIISSVIDNKDLGFALGAADYLVKPVDKTTLLSRIKDLSKRKRGTSTTILCIDDNEQALELLVSILESAEYSIITATSGRQGLEKAVAFKPDIIILDLMMPEVDGFEVAQTLKNHPGTVDIPILVLTAKDLTVDDKMRLAGKIESFIQKSHFTKDDLLMHIKDLEVTYPTRAGLLDEVSGLFDHSYFQIRLAQEVGKAARYKDVFTLVMIDLDNFTEYIKHHGIHRANICIKKIAEFLRKSLRNSDTLVRYGIDEYAIILSKTTKESAEIVARRFLAYIETYPFYGVNIMPHGKITSSISLVSFPKDANSPEDLVFKSHQLLRKTKINGGGKLVSYE